MDNDRLSLCSQNSLRLARVRQELRAAEQRITELELRLSALEERVQNTLEVNRLWDGS